MPEFVRVRDKDTGHHYSINKEKYDRTPDVWELLKQDAVDAAGDPLPMKPKTSVSSEAAKKAGSTATSEKENS
jgi:hypothetical protein